MSIMHSTSFIAFKLSSVPVPPPVHLPPFTCGCHPKMLVQTSHSIEFLLTSAISSRSHRFSNKGGTASVVHFEDFVEKDWSFLDEDDAGSEGEHLQKIDRIISAGNIKETSKVLVSVGSETFVDRLVSLSPCKQVLIVHESLFILACIKEKYDKVKCWQGELINVPEKWAPLDVVYLYFLPALPFELDQVLAALAKNCLPGATIVVSHTWGRQGVEEQRQRHPDVVVSNLPDKVTLETTATDHAFQVVEFVDEPGFYLAVLRKDHE